MRSYFDMELAPIPPKLANQKEERFIFAVFPHGTNSDFRILMDGLLPEAIPSIGGNYRVLAASVLFRIPLVRELALWTNCIDARRSVAEKLLNKKHPSTERKHMSLMVLPGGEAEQIRTIKGKERIFLSQRKGFIKLALKYDTPLVPVYVFGSSDAFNTSTHTLFKARNWLVKNMGICIPISWGVLGSLCPLPAKHLIVFGEPLYFSCVQKNQPTQEEILRCHSLFCDALLSLFNQHKSSMGPTYASRKLEIL
eukprot:CAMPEP_0184861746 /NCGR_PEP_ID=MMETSP0580-20130426/6357_1 /TAXON_ID=1118495 /ORGANISM="Dactyliosolen fragilissimus" /LENGTH=252 /DNA_ID=CAMNT_0027359343 /DNA_START=136 /DNA_END=894 /DNA_ORIENTATION=-